MTIQTMLGTVNQGLVTGDGSIAGPFYNDPGGELRAQLGRSLKLTGAGNTNAGQIKLLGGELDFASDLTNSSGATISGNGTLIVASGTHQLRHRNLRRHGQPCRTRHERRRRQGCLRRRRRHDLLRRCRQRRRNPH